LNNLSIAAKRAKNEKKILKNFFYPNLNSYFNSGVMLIDINKWREKKIIKKSLEFTKKYKNNLKLADQDILNCLFKNNWQTLNKKFNFRATTKNPIPTNVVILHYLTHLKPWSYLYPYKNKKYYLKYLKLSPWSDFKYPDKTCKNILVKHINKIKYILKPFTPLIILEARRKRLKN
jgi:lipopolysaccharide biosynthesis glycosyltransferase